MAKPSDFFVGVTDLFSILLPGAVTVWSAWQSPSLRTALGPLLPAGGEAQWMAFVLAAYAAGHIVFLLASFLDTTYDLFRKSVYDPLGSAIGRAQSWVEVVLRPLTDSARSGDRAGSPKVPYDRRAMDRDALDAARLARDAMLRDARRTMNVFTWAKLLLQVRQPAALTDVNRLEANSKFFRSLVVLFVALAWFPPHPLAGEYGGMLLAAAALWYWRYTEQRVKATALAYRAVVVVLALPADTGAKPAGAVAAD